MSVFASQASLLGEAKGAGLRPARNESCRSAGEAGPSSTEGLRPQGPLPPGPPPLRPGIDEEVISSDGC
jgi:hypothetical protein